MTKERKICFLVSGNGGTLKFLWKAIDVLKLPISIVAVVADRPCGALEFAQKKGIPAYQVTYNRKYPLPLQKLLQTFTVDLIVTNFHKIIDEETLRLHPHKYINLHYSLLPAFAGMIGMETVEAAKQVNARFIGASCHHVIPTVDAGQLIAQCALAVDWEVVAVPTIINTVFRGACMAFLNGILIQFGMQKTLYSSVSILEQNVHFSPAICYDTVDLDNNFWSIIATL